MTSRTSSASPKKARTGCINGSNCTTARPATQSSGASSRGVSRLFHRVHRLTKWGGSNRNCGHRRQDLCSSFTYEDKSDALHLISAWAIAIELTLGLLLVDSKINEITAVPKLLR